MLLKLGADTDDPRWSSDVLVRLLNAVMNVPGGAVGDLLIALSGVLKEHPSDLSPSLANFIKDVVVQCFTRYRSSYETIVWNRFIQSISTNAPPPQLYLALQAIPPQHLPPELGNAITEGLASSCYHQEAVDALAV